MEQIDGLAQLPNLEKTEKPVFVAKPYIYKTDGWLSPRGIFWGCHSDQHEECARYITERFSEATINESEEPVVDDTPARKNLSNHGFAQLNAGTILPVTGQPLTAEQLLKIDNAVKERHLDLRLALSITHPDWEKFEDMALAYKQGNLSALQQDLVREFFDNDCFFRINNNEKEAMELFDALTLGFEEGPRYSYQQGYKRSQSYRISKDGTFAVELDEHIHDGFSGLVSTHWVRVVDKNFMDNLGEESPMKNFWWDPNK